jgi:hypothetical protein
MSEAPVSGAAADGRSALRLLEMIAVNRIIEEIGEVRIEIQGVTQHVTAGAKR